MFVTIPEHIPLEQARKDVCYGSEEPFLDEIDQISEWAVVYAYTKYAVGEQVPEEAFYDAVNEGMATQTLNSLCEKGLVESYWDGEEEVFRLTDDGKDYASKITND